MKAYLIKYDLNYNDYKKLIALVYADDFDCALKKLKDNIPKSIGDYGGSVWITHYENLTIE